MTATQKWLISIPDRVFVFIILVVGFILQWLIWSAGKLIIYLV